MERTNKSINTQSLISSSLISLDCTLSQAYKIRNNQCHINKDQTVFDILTSNSSISKPKTMQQTEDMISRLSSKYVFTITEPTSIYQVESISFDKNPNNTIIAHNKTSCTLLHYYSTIHNISIKFKTQPLLIAKLVTKKKQTKTVYLLPEVSYMVEVDGSDFFYKQPQSNHGRHRCNEDITNNNNDNGINNNNTIMPMTNSDYIDDNDYTNSNIKLSQALNKFIEVDTTTIKDKVIICESSLSSSREIKEYINHKQQIQSMLRKDQWLILYDIRTVRKAKKIKDKLLQIANDRLNINIEEPVMHGMRHKEGEQGNLSQSICDELDSIVNKNTKENSREYYLNMILIILPSKEYYVNIKRFCIEKLGIMSQILIANKSKEIHQYYESIIYQMYQKTGNDLFRIVFSKEESNIMICGVTVCSNTNEINKDICNQDISLSIASSYSSHYTKYHFEYISDLKANALKDKLRLALFNSIDNYNEVNYNCCPPVCYIIYIQTITKLNDTNNNKQQNYNDNDNEILKQVSNMLNECFSAIQSSGKTKASYTIIEVEETNSKKEALKPNEFIITKNKNYAYYSLLNNHSNIPLPLLHSMTLKLTYYNYIKISPIPICLRYSQKGSKLLQDCTIASIKENLKNEAFYL